MLRSYCNPFRWKWACPWFLRQWGSTPCSCRLRERGTDPLRTDHTFHLCWRRPHNLRYILLKYRNISLEFFRDTVSKYNTRINMKLQLCHCSFSIVTKQINNLFLILVILVKIYHELNPQNLPKLIHKAFHIERSQRMLNMILFTGGSPSQDKSYRQAGSSPRVRWEGDHQSGRTRHRRRLPWPRLSKIPPELRSSRDPNPCNMEGTVAGISRNVYWSLSFGSIGVAIAFAFAFLQYDFLHLLQVLMSSLSSIENVCSPQDTQTSPLR